MKKGPFGSIVLGLEELQKEQIRKLDELKSLSKSLQELVVEEEFRIESLIGSSSEHSITPHSEVRFGGRSPVYNAGQSFSLVLQVVPEKIIPVRTILFEGYAPFRVGEKIIAKIPRYKEESSPILGDNNVFYLDREFNSEERAISLASSQREVYLSVDSFNFLKK